MAVVVVPAVLRRLGGLGMGVVAMLVVRLVLVAHLDPVPPAAVRGLSAAEPV
jgi:hypothetical protein